MCIIAIKRAGQTALPADIIKRCWQSNPDGAGFVIHRPGGERKEKLLIQKGFMTLAALNAALDAAAVQEADTVIYHFRIATSGGVSPANCHPFPISSNPQDVKALEITCERAFIHNGIIGKGTKKFSDTQLYVLDTLSGIKNIKKNIKRIARDTTGSRTVTLESNGDMHMTGDWIEDNGYLFSNKSHQYDPSYYDFTGGYGFFDEPECCHLCGESSLIALDGTLVCSECHTAYVQCDNCGAWEQEDAITEYRDDEGFLWSFCWSCCDYCPDDDDSENDGQRSVTETPRKRDSFPHMCFG